MAELFPRGKAEILGIYGPSASANPPQQNWSCNINQIPSMFFDYRCMTSGQLTFGIFIDGKDTGDIGGTHMENPGDVRPFHFWVPQKVRTPGIHPVVVKYGHVEKKPEKIVWDGKAEFSLELTGTKRD
jgi:hypothetical protein